MKRSRIWIFDENRLREALDEYEQASVEAYPKQEERIRTTIRAMEDFLNSEYASKLIMGEEE